MLQKIPDLVRRIEQSHAQGPDQFAVIAKERHAIDYQRRAAVGETPYLTQLGFARTQHRRDARSGDKFGNMAADSLFGAQTQVFGIRGIDELHHAFPVANKRARGKVAHGRRDKDIL